MARERGFAAPIAGMVAWTNQDLLLYHGTIDIYQIGILAGVNVAAGRSDTDFGRGFYTTTNLVQARSWAVSLSQRRRGTNPVVIEFEVSRNKLSKRQLIWFVRGTPGAADFWSLVAYCRSGGANHARGRPRSWYDIAIGPVTSDWKRKTAWHDYDQISFHTTKGAEILDASAKRVFP